MGSVEAHVRIGMQDAGTRYPSFEGWANTFPTRSAALAAAPQHGAPQIAEPVAETAQRRRVTRDSMITVIASHHTFQPLSYDVAPLMHTPAQHCFDLAQCRLHPLGLGCTPDDEIAFGVRRTVVREPQKREGRGFAFTTPLPVHLGEATEFNQSRLLRMEFQRERRQPFLKLCQESLCIVTVLETNHQIVSVADDNNFAAGYFLAPHLDPQIEDIMQIHICQQRRDHRSLRSACRRLRPFAFFRYSRFQPFLDQPKHPVVSNSMRHKLHGPFVAHVVEEAPNIRIEYPVHTLPVDAHMQSVERLMWTAGGTKPIRKAPKVHLVNLVEDADHRLLDDLVFQRRDAQRTLPTVGFRYVHSS